MRQYSLKQAVIHDSEDLSKIYEVVSLVDPEAPGASQQNSRSKNRPVKNTVRSSQNLPGKLLKLSEEQRVAALFPGKNARQEMACGGRKRPQPIRPERTFSMPALSVRPPILPRSKKSSVPTACLKNWRISPTSNPLSISRPIPDWGRQASGNSPGKPAKQYLTIDYNPGRKT